MWEGISGFGGKPKVSCANADPATANAPSKVIKNNRRMRAVCMVWGGVFPVACSCFQL
jgi:hypothetical protein